MWKTWHLFLLLKQWLGYLRTNRCFENEQRGFLNGLCNVPAPNLSKLSDTSKKTDKNTFNKNLLHQHPRHFCGWFTRPVWHGYRMGLCSPPASIHNFDASCCIWVTGGPGPWAVLLIRQRCWWVHLGWPPKPSENERMLTLFKGTVLKGHFIFQPSFFVAGDMLVFMAKVIKWDTTKFQQTWKFTLD